MESDIEIRGRVRRLREEKGWSQSELSRRTGIHTSSLCHLERGFGTVWPGHLKRIAWALNVTVDELRGAA
jgi:transcriptional regulator with XRE-family HTH domain